MCPWCQNPESIDHKAEIGVYPDKCIDLQECKPMCPTNSIVLDGTSHIKRDTCTRCGKCAEACNTQALRLIGKTYR